ncbi:uncharacterized protein LOC126770634 [Nymphalis io]|uniref:uncharacterized protein LOC126770634 n=1 Tax=Inachis io TaxID=171585 RepID=UPI00216744FF|nr:uncharacterized protein LOC126770634 [Nymphalis io]
MAGGASGVSGEAGGGTLRTFGRAEPAPLAAAPPRAHSHRSPAHTDEYTLSRAMTLMVRRTESDSDSSGSPCAECNSSVSYRMPLAPAKAEEVFRAVTDSSAESCGGSGPRDKARRRPRRHHTPNTTRYQQRQEQERRDFTIHV